MRMYDQYKSANWATILTLGLHFGCLSVPFGDFRCLSVPFGAFRCLSVPFGAFRCLSVIRRTLSECEPHDISSNVCSI